MKRISFLLLLLLLADVAAEAAKPAKKSDLRILYVGGSSEFYTYSSLNNDIPSDVQEASVASRMKAFESFLNDYFTSVTVIRADDYVQAMSDDYDVTVMDGTPKPIVPRYVDEDKGIFLAEGYLTEDFDRPMLTIAEASDRMGRRIGTKNDWFCLCLFSDAVNWRAEHPIFHGPFDVKMTVVDKPTPEAFQYPSNFEGDVVPATMPMWRVQAEDYEKGDRPKRIGMVSRSDGYEDSPDAEFISSGVCAKHPSAVAIGRHGNFFHWGFAASPANMTEEAKPVLANAIVYISKFAGQTPIARKYDDRVYARWRGRDRELPVKNPYVYYKYGEVDEDVKSLGIPNDDKRLLDTAIRLLESGKDVDKARRILTRYTLNDFATAGEWRAWYEKYKNKLFFTEAGGWVFLVNSREPGVNDYSSFLERQAAKQVPAGETNDRKPVAITAGVTVAQDGSRVLNIKTVIHPGYHIYDKVAKGDPFIATKVEVTLPDGCMAVGELVRPQGSYYTSNGTTVYKDTVVFSQKFTGDAKGEVKCKVTYQCCDPTICFPPVEKELSVAL